MRRRTLEPDLTDSSPSNFLRTIIEDDLRSGRVQRVVTRFPPEPNGYLHIGHAKAICTSFELATAYGGHTHLRFDDTNPITEETEYVESIQHDLRWLGYDWGEHLYFASDYFEQLFEWAKVLIADGKAYVDEQSDAEIRAGRGTVATPGQDSPHRDRPAAESLDLFERMNQGEFADGAMVLRAKIDMADPNMKLRDPLMYRIRNAHHHRTGDRWHVYPFYDWAHGQSDAIEGISHSLCSIEFDVNRPLYDWYLEQIPQLPHDTPNQYEFSRLVITHTITSKRKLLKLVQDGRVSGWDDPRMPTLAGLRRRGVPAAAIRAFVERVGLSRATSLVDPSLLDHEVRDQLNHQAPRRMAVLDPLEVELTTWPEDHVEWLTAQDWPRDVPRDGERQVPFSGRLYIERSDFSSNPPKGWHRLAPGAEVRLRYGYYLRCEEVVTDDDGNLVRLRCSHDPATKGGAAPPDGRKVKGTLHWVSAPHAVPVQTHLIERLFTAERPGTERDYLLDLNPHSLRTVTAQCEPALRDAPTGSWVQLERTGYFVVSDNAADGSPVLIRSAPLKDGWNKPQTAPEPKTSEGAPGAVGEAKSLPIEVQAAADALVAAGLSNGQARVLATEPELRALYDAALAEHAVPRSVAPWIVSELRRSTDQLDDLRIDGRTIGVLARLVDGGTITGAVGKTLLAELVTDGGDPEAMVAERGLAKVDDAAQIEAWVDAAMAETPDRVAAYRGGRTGLFGYFVGQVMKMSGRRADPQQVKAVLQTRLEGGPTELEGVANPPTRRGATDPR